jgi:hypothetical protein
MLTAPAILSSSNPFCFLLRLLLLLLLVAQPTFIPSLSQEDAERGKRGGRGLEGEEEECPPGIGGGGGGGEVCIVSKHASLHQIFGVNIFGVLKRLFHSQKSPSRPLPVFPFCVFCLSFPTASRGRAQRPPRSLLLPYAPRPPPPSSSPAVGSPDRALCLPTFSHFMIVNKTSLSLSLSLSPPRHSLLVWSPRLHSSSSSSE